MTDALNSEIPSVEEGTDAGPPEPGGLARPQHLLRPNGIRQHVVILWNAAPGFALTLSTMISLVLLAALAALLLQELTKRTITITPISVPKPNLARAFSVQLEPKMLLLLQAREVYAWGVTRRATKNTRRTTKG